MCFLGITAGAHRLWAHHAYKANLPLRVLLMLFNTVSNQSSIYDWARDHRVHHKFSETDADPHNAKRGFFFSHIGWLLVRKHPQVLSKGRTIDMSDLEQDAVVMFQKKYFYHLTLTFFCILPTLIPMYFWGESLNNAWHVAMLRYVWTLNATFLVNSAAHYWGNKPYDKNMYAAQNLGVAIASLGEGWHNYHHVFPWDYKTSELGNYRANFTTAFIDFFAKIGWAYDLKTIPRDTIKRRAERTGDRTHEVWGRGDTIMPNETANNTSIEVKKIK
ncbi:Acyl-CoA Delta(11) desaturase [Gryllus bimaculatus]|nr:Acyl-CoA Delta(11) desaturase [Gryllus bimaculatus]